MESDGQQGGAHVLDHLNGFMAIGLYSPTCEAATKFVKACNGCVRLHRTLRIIAMLDTLPQLQPAASCCSEIDVSVRTASVLSNTTLALQASGARINFYKTRALLRLLLTHAPAASYYVKADTDALLNLPLLQLLLTELPAPIDYLGRSMRLFNLRKEGRAWFNLSTGHTGSTRQRMSRFVYMQGGAYVLSRRAAASLCADCPRGPWSTCPGRFWRDVHNETAARISDGACLSQDLSFNDDLYTGACMAEAAGRLPDFTIAAHPCFWSIPATSHHSTPFWYGLRERCACPLSVHALKDSYPGHGRLLRAKQGLQKLCDTKSGSGGGTTSATTRTLLRQLSVWVGQTRLFSQPAEASVESINERGSAKSLPTRTRSSGDLNGTGVAMASRSAAGEMSELTAELAALDVLMRRRERVRERIAALRGGQAA